jgi:serine/threonine-protein kinase
MPMNENDSTQDMPMPSDGEDRNSRLEEIILQYLKAQDEGRSQECRQLIEQHPEFADELGEINEPIFPRVDEPAAALPARVGRCDILGPLGRGGMGKVLEGHDTQLRRNVAVKLLLEEHRHRPELVRRFVEEAQIAGQLQHPGVTPVYDLGTTPDSLPYFTMKLVKGKTLADLLKARASPAEDRVKFVGIFGQVCQAVAYAHARRVIYRDLKPLNVMVGAFGEVQVMDWGLAKVLPRDDANGAGTAGETLTEVRTEGRPRQVTGAGMGTLAYMPPEQANGEIGRLDERADVFGLGAMLCEVLTGKPAYTGRDREELAAKARAADTAEAFARLDGCGADEQLISLAKWCLGTQPADRPRDAGEVAAAVTTYQNSVTERLRQAELERAAEAARAEEAKATAEQERKAKEAAQAWAHAERRRRRAQLGMATALFLLVILAGGAGAWYRHQHFEMVRDTEAAQTEVAEHRDAGRWAKARTALERASFRLGGGGPEALRERLQRATDDLNLVDRVERIRERRSTFVEGKIDYRSADRDYAAVFRDAGLGEVGQPASEVAARIRASAVAQQLIASLDDWALVTTEEKHRNWLLEVARNAEPEPWRNRYRDPKTWGNRNALAKMVEDVLRDELKLATLKPQLLASLGDRLRWSKADALPFLTAAQSQRPDDFWLIFTLSLTLSDAKRWDEALGSYRGALAVRPQSAAVRNNLGAILCDVKHDYDGAATHFRQAIALDPTDARPHNNLGLALHGKGQVDEAIREYRAAIALDPKAAWPHNNLGHALSDKGQKDEAIREYRTAIALDSKHALAHYNLGAVLYDKGQVDEAIREFRESIALDSTDARPHNNLGAALKDKGQVDEAIREFRESIALDPKLAGAHNNLGLVHNARGQTEAAIAEYRAAIALDPKLAGAHNSLGAALKDKGQVDEAIREFRAAIALDPKDARPHYNLGLVHNARGQTEAAIAEYRAAIALDPKHAQTHNSLGIALYDKGQVDEAIREYRAAIDLDPEYALPHTNLGRALYDKGQKDEAIREHRTAIALDPKRAVAHTNLGAVLSDMGQVDEAIRQLRAAIALDPKFALAYYNLGIALSAKGQIDDAIREYRAAIETNPGYAEAHCNLGLVLLRQKGQFAEALALLRRGHALGTKQRGWKNPSAQWVLQAERLAALDRRATAVLKGEIKARNPSELLKVCVFCLTQKKAPVAAARLYADAFQAEPALADDLQAGDRFTAARAAALAGCGKGRDAADLDEPGRALWRKQALEWLRADLKAWAKRLDGADADGRAEVRTALQRWQRDPDLAGLRDAAALEKLPEVERAAWNGFWKDVSSLLEKTR